MNAFKIGYKVSGNLKITSESNEDLELSVSKEVHRFTVKLKAKKEVQLFGFIQSFPFTINTNDLYFLNGYQSWTDTKEFAPSERERNVNKLPKFILNKFAFDRYGDASFFKGDKNIFHGYDLFYCKGKSEKYVLNLNYKLSYLLIELSLNGGINLSYNYNGYKLVSGDEFTVADYYMSETVKDGMEFFAKIFPIKNTPKIFGYTSWYNYYQDINEKIILDDLSALDEQFNLFQIDDGYETKVGDWLTVDKNKFPNGLKPIVDKIHAKGLKAGIWLAPLVAEEESQLFKTRKDLFKRNNQGEFVKCGSNWSGFYALDLENPEARAYIEKCLRHYVDLGFDFFKLDFLYAANLFVSEGKSRSMAAENAYAFLRECLSDKLILGCGATVFNCIDRFDYLRIGPDVSLIFDDVWYMRFMHRERISTKVTLQNTVYRSIFNGRFFGNDPDVFLLRDDNLKLSKKQREALVTLNALFGSVLMTSDNVGKYDDDKRKLLRKALDLFYNAKVTDYKRNGNVIEISYWANGPLSIKYDTEKGVLL